MLLKRVGLALAMVVAASGCGKRAVDLEAPEGSSFERGGGGGGGGEFVSDAATGAPGGGIKGGGSTGTGTGSEQLPAGILTAGTWDDNLNFVHFTKYRDSLGQKQGLPSYSADEQAKAEADAKARAPKQSLDIALVIDTTGSMGDEIRYLQAEFTAISNALREKHPDVPQRWALVAYRDEGDDYVYKGYDFGNSVAWFQEKLNGLAAGGGGDFPEAPELALGQAAQLSWNPEPGAAKLVFWVADAPHHDKNAGAMVSAVRALRDEGVHVYPVASSGIDELMEYTMRAAAQLTQGRYVFLTDDSGVGGAHKTPTIPCYAVTKLDEAMKRAVASELAGTSGGVALDPVKVIRTVGDPKDGVCAPDNGLPSTLF